MAAEGTSLASLLERLDRAQLERLLLDLAVLHPDLVPDLARQAQALAALGLSGSSKPIPTAAPPIDLQAVEKQVRAIFRGYEGGYIGGAVASVAPVLDQVRASLLAGDGHIALAVLALITDQLTDRYEEFDDSEGEGGDFVGELGALWIDGLLAGNLSADERAGWRPKLEEWAEFARNYSSDSSFDAALLAAADGWQAPPLDVLAGNPPPDPTIPPAPFSPEHGRFSARNELVRVALGILERQDRPDDYLRLAAATGQVVPYTAMLIRLDRPDEAADYALAHPTDVGDALSIAQALEGHAAPEQALRVAEAGLAIPVQPVRDPYMRDRRRAPLAMFARDLAERLGETSRALAAAEIFFREQIGLEAYLAAQRLAGEHWPAHRDALLDYARANTPIYVAPALVGILLHEGLLGEAIALADRAQQPAALALVADAAAAIHPDWVISRSRQQAEAIIDTVRATYYPEAATWLGRAKAAYLAAGRADEWRSYLHGLQATHARKRSLTPLLHRLDR